VSGKVYVVSGNAVIEGRFLDFYAGEWTNDGAPVRRVLSGITPTLNRIRLLSVASGTSLQLLKWQVQLLSDIILLRHFSAALQGKGRIMA